MEPFPLQSIFRSTDGKADSVIGVDWETLDAALSFQLDPADIASGAPVHCSSSFDDDMDCIQQVSANNKPTLSTKIGPVKPHTATVGPDDPEMQATYQLSDYLLQQGDFHRHAELQAAIQECTDLHRLHPRKHRHLPGTILQHLITRWGGVTFRDLYMQSKGWGTMDEPAEYNDDEEEIDISPIRAFTEITTVPECCEGSVLPATSTFLKVSPTTASTQQAVASAPKPKASPAVSEQKTGENQPPKKRIQLPVDVAHLSIVYAVSLAREKPHLTDLDQLACLSLARVSRWTQEERKEYCESALGVLKT